MTEQKCNLIALKAPPIFTSYHGTSQQHGTKERINSAPEPCRNIDHAKIDALIHLPEGGNNVRSISSEGRC